VNLVRYMYLSQYTVCIFSQPLHLRAACIFSLAAAAFASLRQKSAYFRILPPYGGSPPAHRHRILFARSIIKP
jgi:hypothetical protein